MSFFICTAFITALLGANLLAQQAPPDARQHAGHLPPQAQPAPAAQSPDGNQPMPASQHGEHHAGTAM